MQFSPAEDGWLSRFSAAFPRSCPRLSSCHHQSHSPLQSHCKSPPYFTRCQQTGLCWSWRQCQVLVWFLATFTWLNRSPFRWCPYLTCCPFNIADSLHGSLMNFTNGACCTAVGRHLLKSCYSYLKCSCSTGVLMCCCTVLVQTDDDLCTCWLSMKVLLCYALHLSPSKVGTTMLEEAKVTASVRGGRHVWCEISVR